MQICITGKYGAGIADVNTNYCSRCDVTYTDWSCPICGKKSSSAKHIFDLVVTRNKAFVAYLCECKIISPHTEVQEDVGLETVIGRNVIGTLPLHLAAAAHIIGEIPLRTPPELRGAELTLEQIRQYAGSFRIYKVKEIT